MTDPFLYAETECKYCPQIISLVGSLPARPAESSHLNISLHTLSPWTEVQLCPSWCLVAIHVINSCHLPSLIWRALRIVSCSIVHDVDCKAKRKTSWYLTWKIINVLIFAFLKCYITGDWLVDWVHMGYEVGCWIFFSMIWQLPFLFLQSAGLGL